MTRVLAVDLKGPTFYCPDCKRWLATFHDGGVDLAGQAAIELAAEICMDGGQAEGYGTSATCLRRPCRLRRRVRRLARRAV